MPYRPQKHNRSGPKPGEPGGPESRTRHRADLRRRELNTRSTLSRLRNRKSDLK
jgi:hypothetical protein